MSTTTKTAKVTEIENVHDGEWVNLRVKVVQLWDNNNDTISQVGIFGDDTGIIKFVSWSKSKLPLMEEDVEYLVTGIPVSTFKDRYQVSLNSKSTITIVPPEQQELPN